MTPTDSGSLVPLQYLDENEVVKSRFHSTLLCASLVGRIYLGILLNYDGK